MNEEELECYGENPDEFLCKCGGSHIYKLEYRNVDLDIYRCERCGYRTVRYFNNDNNNNENNYGKIK